MELIYKTLLAEAKQSPMLLSDLAGLETYISESYTNRSFIELLQNADDAGATDFLVEKMDGYLIVANNGRCFSAIDVESLCRSASSSKARGNSIGYRGIGFKSVVSIAKEVHIISGDYEMTFSKEITHAIIPEATKVPLIRIPHVIRNSVKNELYDVINRLKTEKYTTFFIFSGVPIEQIKNEYEGFSHTSLLFLNNIRKINVKIENPIVTCVDIACDNEEYKQKIVLNSNHKTEWKIYSENGCSIAFSIVDGKISKLKQDDAKIHAFLPTEDNTGLGVLINTDFSTDPSRRHLIFDDNTNDAIKKICCLYYSLFKKHIVKKDDESLLIIDALLPYFDIRLVHLTNNTYHKQFSLCLKELSTSLSSIKLPPSWLNISDYSKMSTEVINYNCFSIVGFESFLKYFDCKTESITEILNKFEGSNISIVGCAEIASYCIKQSLMNTDVAHFTICNLFSSDNKCYSLEYINDNNLKIDLHYVRMLQDKGVDEKDLKIYFKKFSFDNILNIQFLNEDVSNVNVLKSVKNDSVFNKVDSNKQYESHGRIVYPVSNSNVTFDKIKSQKQSVVLSNPVWIGSNSDTVNKESVALPKKWRSAETNALNILNANGFKLRDVSNNNVGYDLEGLTPEGDDIFIEVKSIDYKGQSFRVTNNEFAVAQQKQDSYYILLFLQKQEYVELGWIRNPIKNLTMNRQCVQWIWVCDEYNYEPLRVDL